MSVVESFAVGGIPSELRCRPEPLIVLSGLDIETNHLHRSIWRAFNASRGCDRHPLKFRCLSVDHQYPRQKLKHAGANEWFLPKGILKTGWMRKHLEQVPAVVAVFYDLDWDERQWENKSLECSQHVETVRCKLHSRESKLVVVLIQKRAPLPPGEDLNAMERAQMLCTKCDLPSKNLFVLSCTNLLYGCISRLESEFHDMATNYYHNRAKRVKNHKDSLNKSSHQLLFVRYEFKIAFFAELKRDQSLATKHYYKAYEHLLEQRMLPTHLLEIKTIAGFINYKLCRLAFQPNASEAISQFRRHIDFFSNLVGIPALAFEHEAWLSKQFEILGDLFQEAIQLSLTAILTQHPGLYYQEAARHAIARCQLSQLLCTESQYALKDTSITKDIEEPTGVAMDAMMLAHDAVSNPVPTDSRKPGTMETAVSSDPLRLAPAPMTSAAYLLTSQSTPELNTVSATDKVDGLEFYGQRFWRQGIQSIEPPNAVKERDGILKLQREELAVDHSELIIPLLDQAHVQFKRYKAERMKLYPLVLMGLEYYDKRNFSKALSCFSSVVGDYRRDRWWSLFTFVLKNLIKCAYVMGHVLTFLSAGLELIGPGSFLSVSEKEHVQQALFQLFKSGTPDFRSFVPELNLDIETIEQLWKEQILLLSNPISPTSNSTTQLQSDLNESLSEVDQSVKTNSCINLDVSQLAVCVECKVMFTQSKFSVDQPIQLAVFIRSSAPLMIGIDTVTVNFSHKIAGTLSSDTAHSPTHTTNTTIRHSSQSWPNFFTLDPSDPIRLILFSLNLHTLVQQIKVDGVYLSLSYPEYGLTTMNQQAYDGPRFFISWNWSSIESQTMMTTNVNTRSAEVSTVSKITRPIDPLSTDKGFWINNDVPSVLERHRQSVSLRTNESNFTDVVLPELPSIPPRWELIGTRHQTEIHDRTSSIELEIKHNEPALSGELYTVQCRIRNHEPAGITQLKLTASVTEQPSIETGIMPRKFGTVAYKEADEVAIGDIVPHLADDTSVNSTRSTSSLQFSHVTTFVDLPDLPKDMTITFPIILRLPNPGLRSLRCHLSYQTAFPNPIVPNLLISVKPSHFAMLSEPELVQVDGCKEIGSVGAPSLAFVDESIQSQCAKVLLTDIIVQHPFDLTWQTMSLQHTLISDLIVGEEFLLQLNLTNRSPLDLQVVSTSFQLNASVTFFTGSQDVQLDQVSVGSSERVSECQLLIANEISPQNSVLTLGNYVIHWRRRNTCDNASDVIKSDIVTTVFELLSCSVLELPVRVRASIPSIGTQLSPITVFYNFQNRTIYPQEALIRLESTPNIMFSGPHKLRTKLLPGSPQVLQYVFVPLRAGILTLPRLHISMLRYGKPGSSEEQTFRLHMEQKLVRDIPTQLFVLPPARDGEEVTGVFHCASTVTNSSDIPRDALPLPSG